MSQTIRVEVGAGELIDKITILGIKSERIAEPGRQANVRREMERLCAVRDAALPDSASLREMAAQLHVVNAELWQLEDDIRRCDAAGDFGATFIATARAIYTANDRRSALKRDIDRLSGSAIVEEKLYAGSG